MTIIHTTNVVLTPSDKAHETPLHPHRGDAAHALHAWAQQRGGRLLVADDGPVERAVTVFMLKKVGFDVLVAVDGREALEIVRDSPLPLDGLVLDMNMPEMDGVTAARMIRALPCPRRHLPIIALTANDGAEDRKACLAAGMNAHTLKPLSLPSLLRALQAHLPTRPVSNI